MSRLASVDLGTNTFRMLIAEKGAKGVTPLRIERAIVRLGEGMHQSGSFCHEAIQRVLNSLRRFRAKADSMGVSRVRVVGTSAFREASNREFLIEKVKEETGWHIEVISGLKEAELTAKGAFLGLDLSAWPVLLLDIGGGSTEYSLIEESSILVTESTPLGVVHMTERFVEHDPPTQQEVRSLRVWIRVHLQEMLEGWKGRKQPSLVVGVAGTPTTMAALHQRVREYRHELVHGYQMGLQEIEALTSKLLGLTTAQRLALPGMEEGREDLIVSGAILLEESIKAFGCDQLLVSDCGLLEGVLMEMVEENAD